jgi:tRNA uridine 5-carboxymethylaminomethyl modification enzyme
LSQTNITPDEVKTFLPTTVTPIQEKQRANKLLLRPQIELSDLENIPDIGSRLSQYEPLEKERASISIKYKAYIEKEIELADKMRRLENVEIPDGFNYMKLNSISMEAREKLSAVKPTTLGQATRISGVNPADIQVLLVYFGR